ncbi:restriction endonuclease [Moraxella osloensis]|uniref:Restriction endonuclease n=1 Tax=Faucicola osloensis TaxID=34062 RepID=A0AAD0AF05_FAUOS|nr:restriction endonuclease [Moraxella osloensis]ATW86523.1 restriction endonuclease [Moraxella osloensis]
MLASANLYTSDIQENELLINFPQILDILLIDRTSSKPSRKRNIIWANDNYSKFGRNYTATAQIKPDLITGQMGGIIKPRALKTADMQKKRTKSKAEVFTPIWIVKKQNDILEQAYKDDDLPTYVSRKWLEITCGEAPYMTTRYDMETGELIPLSQRQGFVDRKLAKINAQVDDKAEWQYLVEKTYQSSYGFEWNGDSLLLARENLLFTYRDYYLAKWQQEPSIHLFEVIAKIISYNVFQMDGLKYIIPLSEKHEKIVTQQLSMFEEEAEEQWLIRTGKRVKIMNWDTNKMEYFDKDLKK